MGQFKAQAYDPVTVRIARPVVGKIPIHYLKAAIAQVGKRRQGFALFDVKGGRHVDAVSYSVASYLKVSAVIVPVEAKG